MLHEADTDNWDVQLSIVIPCYNEEAGLAELVRRVIAAAENEFGRHYELILVNDGSSDNSWALICDHANNNGRITGVDLARNHGHQLALSAGLQQVRGQYVFILDADLQDPPELLGPMMAEIHSGYDVVYGQRKSRSGESIFKKKSAKLFYRTLNRLVDVRIPQDTGDFRLMTRTVLDHLNQMPERFRFIRGMVSWIGLRQKAFMYDRDARFAGETKYPLHKMMAFALDAITSFSVIPLKLASAAGALTGLAAFLTIAWVFIAWLSGNTASGWTSLTAIVLFMGSIQLTIMGIMGEYLGRMYIEAKGRPLFVVQQVYNNAAATKNPVQEIRANLEKLINE